MRRQRRSHSRQANWQWPGSMSKKSGVSASPQIQKVWCLTYKLLRATCAKKEVLYSSRRRGWRKSSSSVLSAANWSSIMWPLMSSIRNLSSWRIPKDAASICAGFWSSNNLSGYIGTSKKTKSLQATRSTGSTCLLGVLDTRDLYAVPYQQSTDRQSAVKMTQSPWQQREKSSNDMKVMLNAYASTHFARKFQLRGIYGILLPIGLRCPKVSRIVRLYLKSVDRTTFLTNLVYKFTQIIGKCRSRACESHHLI